MSRPCRRLPPPLSYVGACSLRSQCPHAPASHWQSQMPGPGLRCRGSRESERLVSPARARGAGHRRTSILCCRTGPCIRSPVCEDRNRSRACAGEPALARSHCMIMNKSYFVCISFCFFSGVGIFLKACGPVPHMRCTQPGHKAPAGSAYDLTALPGFRCSSIQ